MVRVRVPLRRPYDDALRAWLEWARARGGPGRIAVPRGARTFRYDRLPAMYRRDRARMQRTTNAQRYGRPIARTGVGRINNWIRDRRGVEGVRGVPGIHGFFARQHRRGRRAIRQPAPAFRWDWHEWLYRRHRRG